MTVISSTYSAVRVPQTTITFDTETLFITASCELIGLAPARAASADEMLDGVMSLDPPLVRTGLPKQVPLDLLIRACASSIAETPDTALTVPVYAAMVLAVTIGYRRALERLVFQFTTEEKVRFGLNNILPSGGEQ